MRINPGEVWLVGAGPGDPGLLTLAAADALRAADVVFHDALVGERIISMIQKRKRRDVGKRGGRASISQDEICEKLIHAARAGLRVVRLKGGDPFVFGRGGEELSQLHAAGIRVHVIPGVTAGLASPLRAGIPVTDRRLASSVTLLTAVEEPGRARRRLTYVPLVKAGGTLVFYMGLSRLGSLIGQLRRSGAPAQLPVAVISRGTTRAQRTVSGTLATIESLVTRHGLCAPALIVAGRMVAARAPLAGSTILVMRTREQAGRLSGLLKKRGATVLEIPVLEIMLIHPNPKLDRHLRRSAQYDWIVFTSANAVEACVSRAKRLGVDLTGVRGAAIGPATAAAMRRAGWRRVIQPESESRAEGVLDVLLAAGRRGDRVLLPRAKIARDVLPQTLRRAGRRVDVVPVYVTRKIPGAAARVRGLIQRGAVDQVILTSSSMVDVLASAARGLDLSGARVVSIGPITTATARAHGLPVDIEALTADMASVADAAGVVRNLPS